MGGSMGWTPYCRQLAVDAQGVCDGLDALGGVSTLRVAHATELIVGEIQLQAHTHIAACQRGAIDIWRGMVIGWSPYRRQLAVDGGAKSLADELGTHWADALVRCVDRGYLADLAATDAGEDGAPALVTQIVVSEVEAVLPD